MGKTPSGGVLSWRDGYDTGLNIVSTRWRDYDNLILDFVPSPIELPNGESVSCQGSICAEWTFENEVDVKWQSVRFFVVDVDITNGPGSTFNFVISRRSMPPEKMGCRTYLEISRKHLHD